MTQAERRQGAREALMSAAKCLFVERGYRAVSTRDLAETAGVNLAAIQYHFGSKAKLFVEVFDSMMAGGLCEERRKYLSRPIEGREDAAKLICEFVWGFVGYLLASDAPRACPLMLREVMADDAEDPELIESLVGTVIDKYMRPMSEALVRAVGIIAPGKSRAELELYARSISGQCAFYPAHRIFIERISGSELFSEEGLRSIAAHITSFSLRGLGCSEELVRDVLAYSKDLPLHSETKS